MLSRNRLSYSSTFRPWSVSRSDRSHRRENTYVQALLAGRYLGGIWSSGNGWSTDGLSHNGPIIRESAKKMLWSAQAAGADRRSRRPKPESQSTGRKPHIRLGWGTRWANTHCGGVVSSKSQRACTTAAMLAAMSGSVSGGGGSAIILPRRAGRTAQSLANCTSGRNRPPASGSLIMGGSSGTTQNGRGRNGGRPSLRRDSAKDGLRSSKDRRATYLSADQSAKASNL